jgi:uncharacterized protein (TIGR03790 family)
MTRLIARVCAALIAVCAALAGPAQAQTPDNVAVVINENSAASQLVGEYYVRKRRIPAANVVRIRVATDETIDRASYDRDIERPVAEALSRGSLQDRILYIVLTKGVPLRIAGSGGTEGTLASVDSELTLLYRKMTGQAVPTLGRIPNPYFLNTAAMSTARRFGHRDYDIYLVTRLDAFTADEAVSLVDAGAAPTAEGQIVLDQRAALTNRAPDDWLASAAKTIAAVNANARVVLDTTPQRAVVTGPVIGYYSWGATDPQLRTRSVGLRFAPGAVAATFAGPDARTFEAPPPTWVPMREPSNRTTWFGGSPQSLVGDLIREGVTGVAGFVGDPFVQAVVRPDVLFPAYLSGFNLAESFYIATPFLSWQTVVVGDPLCQPFTRAALPRGDVEAPIDESTELPAFFSERRVRLTRAALGADAKVAALVIRAEGRLARNDRTGARALLEQAAAAAPSAALVHLRLATLDEAIGDRDAAMAGYRRVLQLQPNNAVALNNLAFNLSTDRNALMEARSLATRAVTQSRRAPTVVDTLGWIEHLLGNDAAAVSLLTEAVRGAPASAEIRLHAAVVFAARGDLASAAAHLKEALRRNPELDKHPDVVALRERLRSQGATP